MKESNFQTQVIKYLRETHGAYVVKYIAGSVFGTSGVPDLLVCVKGKFLALELKVGYNNATELQMVHIRKIRNSLGRAEVFRHDEHWKSRLDDIVGSL